MSPGLERFNRQRHGEIRLARTRRTDGKCDVVFADRVDVTRLAGCPRLNPLGDINDVDRL
jgi:hypothetical protein